MAVIVFEEETQHEVEDEVVRSNVRRLTNQVYRLLPAKEEEEDWIKPLETALLEIIGMGDLFPDQPLFLTLVSKLDGLFVKNDEIEFQLFRRTIFECCGILNKIEKSI